jgi:hypothetical protein
VGVHQSAGSVAARWQGTVSRLQRAIGNQNALRFLQTKLAINQPGDRYEQAADRMADTVVQSESGPAPCACESSGTLCTECASKKLQRMGANVAHGTPPGANQGAIGTDMKQEARGHAGTEAPPVVHQALMEKGRPLDAGTRAFMEPRFGHDFSGVRVHTGSLARESARAIGARAYTVGRDIVFAGGEHAPENPMGRRLLAHELSHVVQQGAANGAFHSDGILQRQPAAPPQVTQTPAQADEELEKILRAAARGRTKTGVEAMLAATEVVYRMISRYLPEYVDRIAGVGYDAKGPGVVAGPNPKAGETPKQGRYIDVTPGAGFIARVSRSNINMMAEELRVALSGTGISPVWDQAKYTEAKTKHEEQQKRAKEILENFRKQPHTTKQEKLLANSLEWIRSDEKTQGRFELLILTPTHYSQAAGGTQTFFDLAKKYPEVGGDYDPTGKDQRGLIEEQPTTAGKAFPLRFPYTTGLSPVSSVLIFLQPDEPVTLERLSGIITHETQHVADRIETVPAPIPDIESVKRLYQTEFHAYWIETRVSWPRQCQKMTMSNGLVLQDCTPLGPVDTSGPDFGSAKKQAHKSTVKGSEVKHKDECKKLLKCDDLEKKEQPTNFRSERQQKIFEHMVNMYPNDLFDCAYVCDDSFRNMVNGMTGPVGVNLVNSVRIEALLETLEPKTPKIENVKDAARLLDDNDRAFLKDQAQAKPFWDLLGKKLQTAEVAEIKKIIWK